MAKIEGTQSIPAELKTLYDGALTPVMPDGTIRGRYPWEKPNKQLGGYGVSAAELEQRTRWLEIRDKFKNVSWAVRQRWYAARPPWASLLWYFNYFMMSGLMGNAVVGDKGGGVIKDIHHYTFTLPSGTPQDVTISVDTTDPSKAVCFFFGAGWKEILTNFAIVVYPYLVSMNSTQLFVRGSLALGESADCGVSLIEYI